MGPHECLIPGFISIILTVILLPLSWVLFAKSVGFVMTPVFVFADSILHLLCKTFLVKALIAYSLVNLENFVTFCNYIQDFCSLRTPL
jgi:hypothetical protein